VNACTLDRGEWYLCSGCWSWKHLPGWVTTDCRYWIQLHYSGRHNQWSPCNWYQR